MKNNNNLKPIRCKAPQRNTYKPQNVNQISKNEMKTQGHSRQV